MQLVTLSNLITTFSNTTIHYIQDSSHFQSAVPEPIRLNNHAWFGSYRIYAISWLEISATGYSIHERANSHIRYAIIREYLAGGRNARQCRDEWPVICDGPGGGVGRRCGSTRRVIKYLHCHRRSRRLIPELIVFHFIQRLRAVRLLSGFDKHGVCRISVYPFAGPATLQIARFAFVFFRFLPLPCSLRRLFFFIFILNTCPSGQFSHGKLSLLAFSVDTKRSKISCSMKLSSMKDDFVWLVDSISTFIENVSLGSFACLSRVNRVFGIYRIYNMKHEPVTYTG